MVLYDDLLHCNTHQILSVLILPASAACSLVYRILYLKPYNGSDKKHQRILSLKAGKPYGYSV